jgi:hypothetical protein
MSARLEEYRQLAARLDGCPAEQLDDLLDAMDAIWRGLTEAEREQLDREAAGRCPTCGGPVAVAGTAEGTHWHECARHGAVDPVAPECGSCQHWQQEDDAQDLAECRVHRRRIGRSAWCSHWEVAA